MYGWNTLGERVEISQQSQKIALKAWEQRDLNDLSVKMPDWPGLVVCTMRLIDNTGKLLHANFSTFKVQGAVPTESRLTFEPASFTKEKWSEKQWNILDGLKINGAGHGFFEYELEIPERLKNATYSGATLIVEVSSKPLNGKDKDQRKNADSNYMRGKGLQDPSQNPNSYPMTDEYNNPSEVTVSINGKELSTVELFDDPADHRGILSWHAQLRDRKLREAGTYGYLICYTY